MLNAMISNGYKPPQDVLNTVLDTCTTRKNTRKVSAARNYAAVLGDDGRLFAHVLVYSVRIDGTSVEVPATACARRGHRRGVGKGVSLSGRLAFEA